MARKARSRRKYSLPARRSEATALIVLLVLAGLAIAGPSGLFAWSDNLRLRDAREARLAKLQVDTGHLRNRVDLLDPAHADPDLAGELVRSQMGVVHPDEVVVKIED
jgi:cell division protein FtsB